MTINPAKRAAVVRIVSSGGTYKEAATAVGISYDAARDIAIAAGVRSRRHSTMRIDDGTRAEVIGMIADGATYAATAAAFRLDYETVRRIASSVGVLSRRAHAGTRRCDD